MEQVRERDTEIASHVNATAANGSVPYLMSDNGQTGAEAVRLLCDAERSASPFEDLSLTLYLFTRRLYDAALKDGVKDLFFFAREGLLLQQMFDVLQAGEAAATIRTHYLKVSRRSTFLLSLRSLDQERFEVLFRQYRRISIAEFLKSLALEEYLPELAADLGVVPSQFAERSADLPHDPLFVRLLKQPSFARVYETQRLARSSAFESYVASFCGGTVPDRLSVVDVGWKGSIQDNVFGWLHNLRGDAARVKGYYVGLVANGNAGPANEKAGLLFSSASERTAGYHVFNENRSLFEVLLHANHGSAQRYIRSGAGDVVVVDDDFEEGPMIETTVKPVAERVMARFVRIAELASHLKVSPHDLLVLAIQQHARMVFRPSPTEIEWMRSVSHVENFGVFEASTFKSRHASRSFATRLRFSINVFRSRYRDLGFWPWLTIQERALWGMAGVYRAIRMQQTRRTLRPLSRSTDNKAAPK
ncbi:hypothetical protein [Burkholderia stabilis]|uniref:hypothetical protein n=1 Tax=Burkholderia stabilis TaxID=95485 RepID=UPI001589E406|nr:hypothetical protein [Burkholderia stabilis]